MENLLELRNVCKNYPSFSLKDVSFSLPAGSIMGFIGENGAGKTTTIKLILNEIRRDGGDIEIFGKDAVKEENEIKEQIGVVFDESYFSSVFSAADIGKILGGVFRNWDAGLFQKYLKEFGLPEKKKIKGYSKGMKMKLSIASALAHRPRLLILDEATSGLDPVMRGEILDIFLDFIQQEDRGVLFSSHITSDLERVADYITYLHEGQIVFSRSKDEISEKFGILKCGASQFGALEKGDFLRVRRGACDCEALVADRAAAKRKYPDFLVERASLDEIMMLYGRGVQA